jgi:hypothetical protein
MGNSSRSGGKINLLDTIYISELILKKFKVTYLKN